MIKFGFFNCKNITNKYFPKKYIYYKHLDMAHSSHIINITLISARSVLSFNVVNFKEAQWSTD